MRNFGYIYIYIYIYNQNSSFDLIHFLSNAAPKCLSFLGFESLLRPYKLLG